VHLREVNGLNVLLLDSGGVILLNSTASLMLDYLMNESDFDSMINDMLLVYEVDKAMLVSDALYLIAQLNDYSVFEC
jgi:hypothetical protein